MRVVMVSHMWPSPGDDLHGKFVVDLVKAVIAHGIDMRVIAPVPFAPGLLTKKNAKWAGYNAVADHKPFPHQARPTFIGFPYEWSLGTYPRRCSRAINKVLNDWYEQDGWEADVIHAQTAAQAGISAVRTVSQPVVITTHGRDMHESWFMGQSVQRNIQEAYSKAAARVWDSNNLIQEAVDLHAMQREDHDHVIYNGIGEVPDLSAGVLNDGVRVGFVSRLIEGKGVQVLLDALGLLVEQGLSVDLQAVGEGPMRTQLEAQAQQLGVPTTWHGEHGTQESFALLRGCNMFCLPSFAEGFGLVYFEAMKAGLPAIGCYDTGFVELVSDGINVRLSPQKDADALAAVIAEMGTNREMRLRIANAGHALVGNQYSWEQSAREHIQLYRNVLDESKNSQTT